MDTLKLARSVVLALTMAFGSDEAVARTTAEKLAAIERYEERDYSEAQRRFAMLAEQEAGDADVLFYLGRIALWFDDEAAALRHLNAAVRLTPAAARVHNALGDAYGLAAQNAPFLAKLGWARKCRAAYERAVALEPQNPTFRWSLLGFCIVAPRIAGGGLDEAEVLAAEIGRLDDMNGRVARATVALSKRKFEAAFAEFEAVLRERPDEFMALYHIGRCAALSGTELQRGMAALQRCLALAPPRGDDMPTHACVHYRLGNILEKLGEAEGAAREYGLARQKHPDFRPAKIQLRN